MLDVGETNIMHIKYFSGHKSHKYINVFAPNNTISKAFNLKKPLLSYFVIKYTMINAEFSFRCSLHIILLKNIYDYYQC